MGTIPAHHTPPSSPPDAPVCVVVVTGSAALHPRAIAAVPPGAYVVAADGGLDHARAAGNHLNSRCGHRFFRLVFFPHQPDSFWRRADKSNVRCFADFREVGIFR